MCIIASKPAGVPMPSEETLRNMWTNNPDGAGFMYAKEGKVRIEKGFMKFKEFQAAISALEKKNDLTSIPMVLHFRITTHGGTCKENCHPFPVTRSIKLLQQPKSTATLGIAHNGIISSVSPRKGISDTMEYVATQLAPLYSALPEFYRNKDAVELIANAIQSKMALLNGNGEIFLIGSFTEHDGISYSNTTFQASRRYDWGGWSCWDSYAGGPVKATYGYGCSDEYDLREDYDAEQRLLLWGWDFPEGCYGKYDNGELIDEEFIRDCLMLDERGRVYKYDWEYDVAVYQEGITLYTAQGGAIPWEDELAEPTWVEIRLPAKPKTTKSKGKK